MNLLKSSLNSLTGKIILFFLTISLFCCHLSTSYAEKITFGTDEWCPYICEPDSNDGLKGYIADIALTVFRNAGYEAELLKTPLKRAFTMCRKGKLNAILSIYKEDAPDLIFPESEQGISSNIFLTTKKNPWKYKDMESLKQLKELGLVEGYEYPVLDNFISANPEKITRIRAAEEPLKILLEMMKIGRIDALLDDETVIRYTLKKMKLTDSFTEAGAPEDSNPVYIGFSPAIPESDKYARILVVGMEKLRKSGEMDKILNKYGLQDWKK